MTEPVGAVGVWAPRAKRKNVGEALPNTGRPQDQGGLRGYAA